MKKIAVLTSGGDSPGMNPAVRSVVRCGLKAGLRVYGIRRGYSGLLEGRFEEMDWNSVSGLLSRGGSILECARCPEMLEPHGPADAAGILHRREIQGLIVIGGDGSFRGAMELCKHGVPVNCITGTIDNDIPGTERTIGFDTACDTLSWCISRLRDTAASHQRTFIVEAMGRYSGWLALYGGIAGGADVILIPEIAWKQEEVLSRVKDRIDAGKKFHLIVIAEGAGRATDLSGYMNQVMQGDAEVRVCIPGHIQRGGAPTTVDRLFATQCGFRAVDAILAGRFQLMIGEQGARITEVPLEAAVSGKRTIDQELYELALRVG